VPTTFYIRAKDKYGNLRLTGGDAFHISFQGPCGTQQDTRAQVFCACVCSSCFALLHYNLSNAVK
jgi:hypothetical protein